MSRQPNLWNIPNVISSPESAAGQERCASPDGPMTGPSGPDHALANLSARQAQEKGFADERHLWPYWFHLIRVCKPPVIFGEQVASKLALSWLDLVFDDLEAEGYACGAADLCAAGVGAPHIRQRFWFVAHAGDTLSSWRKPRFIPQETGEGQANRIGSCSAVHLLGHSKESGLAEWEGERRDNGEELPPLERTGGTPGHVADALSPNHRSEIEAADLGQPKTDRPTDRLGGYSGSLDSALADSPVIRVGSGDGGMADTPDRPIQEPGRGQEGRNGYRAINPWHDCTYLPCRDGKWRPIKPGLSPLALRISARVGRLRAAGNAICPEVAQQFIKAYME